MHSARTSPTIQQFMTEVNDELDGGSPVEWLGTGGAVEAVGRGMRTQRGHLGGRRRNTTGAGVLAMGASAPVVV